MFIFQDNSALNYVLVISKTDSLGRNVLMTVWVSVCLHTPTRAWVCLEGFAEEDTKCEVSVV